MKSLSPSKGDFSIRLPGTLVVKTYRGDYRSFNIGELTTPLCEFKVIDKWLEQLDDGTYEGEFWISRIDLNSRPWRSRLILEMQARVLDYRLKETDRPSRRNSVDIPEQDPLVDEAKPAISSQGRATLRSRDRSAKPAVTNTPGKGSGRSDNVASAPPLQQKERRALEGVVDLFGQELAELVAQGNQPIKLDATVDRELFRTQRDWLKRNGFSFDLEFQHWLPASS